MPLALDLKIGAGTGLRTAGPPGYTAFGRAGDNSIAGGAGNDDLFGDVAVTVGSAFGDGEHIIDGDSGDDFTS